ncbi:argininosuccinate lyase [Beggiatoa leptomitoformis]|uniref:Argininosuccinate lyase n=1 Tax=Beggiatoa leptomitoformis TaxID=288004 RepID=A0A2N9YBI7_9GAMM|nr:argininosuccinate lyase [Beggiatoa leptomitoformis]ALG66822.1 argininosuccinate lyase [Beggiatoa leptomitoformis]AUI67827.1 argininosuccinate lyase [Beggiatoa leptomitoformis]
MTTIEKPWSGRFTAPTDAFVEAFTASVTFDQRLYAYDIMGSIAHATMLARVGVLTQTECEQIISGLQSIQQEIESGQLQWSIALEDVHMNIETRLTQKIGIVGKKLHTGRSRNDQVATDVRLYLRHEIDTILAELNRLLHALISVAEREVETILPGFTHLQSAQPITFGHHLLAWCEMLLRDKTRLQDCRKRMNTLPLGAAALAGTSYPLDRHYTAALLGFEAVAENSLDAVSDRDFAIEFTSAATLIMMHLSRFSEELVLWSSAQFNFIELSDAFCTGSSIMPQKKNPDVPELVRGKTGRVYGALISLLTLMKSQPLAYNKDNQEDKEPLFDTVDTLKGSLKVYADMIPAMQVNRDIMRKAALQGFTTATDLADYLVRKGIPFRDAHEIVGKAVRYGVENNIHLEAVSLETYKQFSALIEQDVYNVLSLEGSVAARNIFGGTAPQQVRAAIQRLKAKL